MLWFDLQNTRAFRRPGTVTIGFLLIMGWNCGKAPGQELNTIYANQGTDCVPNPRSLKSSGQQLPATPDDLISWRAHPLDDKTTSDLFGRQFNRKFLVYRLCLVNNGIAGRGPRSTVYLIQDFLRIPVTTTPNLKIWVSANSVTTKPRPNTPAFANQLMPSIDRSPPINYWSARSTFSLMASSFQGPG